MRGGGNQRSKQQPYGAPPNRVAGNKPPPLRPPLPDDGNDPVVGLSPVNSPALAGYVEMLSAEDLLGAFGSGGRAASPPPPMSLSPPTELTASLAPSQGAASSAALPAGAGTTSPQPSSHEKLMQKVHNSPTPEHKNHEAWLPPGAKPSGFGSMLSMGGGSKSAGPGFDFSESPALTASVPPLEAGLKADLLPHPAGDDEDEGISAKSLLGLSPHLPPTDPDKHRTMSLDSDALILAGDDWTADLIS